MQAILALEDGRVFRGKGYGAKGECHGEVVFNTSITGYQEIFTDPSYSGQIVVLTNPEIGNYGTNTDDNEANRPYIEGLIVREFSRVSSNWRSQQVAEEYLEQFKVPVLADIDTRALVRHLRDNGVMRGVVSSLETDADKLVAKARSIPKMDGMDLAKVVSTKSTYVWETGERSHLPDEIVGVKDEPARFHVVAYDFGIKHNILRKLRGEGCKVTVVPAQTPAEDVLGVEAGWRVFVERPWRSRTLYVCGGQYSSADGPPANLRNLSGTSACRDCFGRKDVQTEVWPPWWEPSGEAVAYREDRDHGPQSQFCRRSGFDCRKAKWI